MFNALKQALATLFVFDWSKFDAMAALRATTGVAVPLVIGGAVGNSGIGVFGAMGALSVGFGSFHEAAHRRVPVMLVAAAGMAASIFVGAIAGSSAVAATSAAAAWGAMSGLLAALGPAASFVGLQAAIGLLVAAAFPAAPAVAAVRAALVMGGGLVQIVLLLAIEPRLPVDPRAVTSKAVSSMHALRGHAQRRSPALMHALRLAAALAAATAIYRALALPRGSWIPVTALLVLKPDLHETFARGLARMGGTAIGAICATVIMVAISPGARLLVPMIVGFVWAGYAVFRTNYALFTICITCYVVFLIVLAGGAEPATAWYRIVNTIIGGSLALVIAAIWPVTDEVLGVPTDGERPI